MHKHTHTHTRLDIEKLRWSLYENDLLIIEVIILPDWRYTVAIVDTAGLDSAYTASEMAD